MYLINICIDPGYYRINKDYLSLIENIKNNGESKVCIYCNVVWSKYNKHCDICNRCVLWFDHHCYYINNCVGKNNIRVFLLFLINTSIIISLTLTIEILIILYKA